MKLTWIGSLVVVALLAFVVDAVEQPVSKDEARMRQLRKQLLHRNPEQRLDAARQLGELAFMVRSAASLLHSQLQDPNSAVRAQAARTLTTVGPRIVSARFSLLRAIVKETDSEALTCMIGALVATAHWKDFRQHCEECVPVVTPFVKHKDVRVRLAAVSALGVFGRETLRVVPTLREAINDPDPGQPKQLKVSVMAILRLQELGVKDKKSIDALFAAAVDKDFDKQIWARAALSKLVPTDRRLKPLITRMLMQDKNLTERFAGTRCVRHMGKHGEAYVPLLINALHTKNADRSKAAMVRRGAFHALKEIGPAAKAAIPALEDLAQWDQSLRNQALKLVERLQKVK